MTPPYTYDHAQPIKAALEDASLLVGDHVAPKSTTGEIVAPCTVLYMSPSPTPTGSLGCPDTDGKVRFRLISVGMTADQAMDQSKAAIEALRAADVLVTDRAIFRVKLEAPGRVERDDDVNPPCFYSSDDWSLISVTANGGS